MLNYVMTSSIVSYLYPIERPFHMTFSFGEVVCDDIKGFKPSLPLGETSSCDLFIWEVVCDDIKGFKTSLPLGETSSRDLFILGLVGDDIMGFKPSVPLKGVTNLMRSCEEVSEVM